MSIEFKNPPESITGRGKHRDIAEALRARPGEWALCFPGSSTGYASNLTNGRLVAFPKGEFEVTSRTDNKGGRDIYIRFVGGAK